MEAQTRAMHQALDKYLKVYHGPEEAQAPIADDQDDSRHYSIRESIENFHGLYNVSSARKQRKSGLSQSIIERPIEGEKVSGTTPADSEDEGDVYQAEILFGDIDGDYFLEKGILGMMKLHILAPLERAIRLGHALKNIPMKLNFKKSVPHSAIKQKNNAGKLSMSRLKGKDAVKNSKARLSESWLKSKTPIEEKREIPSPNLSKPKMKEGKILSKTSSKKSPEKSKGHAKSRSLNHTSPKKANIKLEIIPENGRPKSTEKQSHEFDSKLSLESPAKSFDNSEMHDNPGKTAAKIERDLRALYRMSEEMSLDQIRSNIHGYLGNIEGHIKILVEKCDDYKKIAANQKDPEPRPPSSSNFSTGNTEGDRPVGQMVETDSEKHIREPMHGHLYLDKQTDTHDLSKKEDSRIGLFFKKSSSKPSTRAGGVLKQRPAPPINKPGIINHQISTTSQNSKPNLFLKRSSKPQVENRKGSSKPRFSNLEELLSHSGNLKKPVSNSLVQPSLQPCAQNKKSSSWSVLFSKRYRAKSTSLGRRNVSSNSSKQDQSHTHLLKDGVKLQSLLKATLTSAKNKGNNGLSSVAKVFASSKKSRSMCPSGAKSAARGYLFATEAKFSTLTGQLEKALNQLKNIQKKSERNIESSLSRYTHIIESSKQPSKPSTVTVEPRDRHRSSSGGLLKDSKVLHTYKNIKSLVRGSSQRGSGKL